MRKKYRSSLFINECIKNLTANQGRKRYRRPASEISRHFHCPVPGCGKSYGSEGSMLQHVKNKHKEFEMPPNNSKRRNAGAGYAVPLLPNPQKEPEIAQKEEAKK